uniref:DUF19 domain-containing protein n=1 Tax=Loa loa TaxID=7209 RepID=A0A1I7VQZ4_LOALO
MEFVDEHFGVICSKTGNGNLLEPFACLRKVIIEEKQHYKVDAINDEYPLQECIGIIQHNTSTSTIHCNQLSHFFDCLFGALQRKCTLETQFFFADIIINFGCTAHSNHYRC